MTGKHRTPNWPPSAPGDAGWAGDSLWGGWTVPREGRASDIDALDPRFPIALTEPPATFWKLTRHPPVKARWRSHLDFTIDEAARATDAGRAPVETFVVPMGDTAPIPVIRVPVERVRRTLPGLDEDTLAHEFTEADREHLTTLLGPLELTMPGDA